MDTPKSGKRRSFCVQAKPHLYLHEYRCGCKVWRARRPKTYRFATSALFAQATAQARVWNLTRFCGATPCAEHDLAVREPGTPLSPTPKLEQHQ